MCIYMTCIQEAERNRMTERARASDQALPGTGSPQMPAAARATLGLKPGAGHTIWISKELRRNATTRILTSALTGSGSQEWNPSQGLSCKMWVSCISTHRLY